MVNKLIIIFIFLLIEIVGCSHTENNHATGKDEMITAVSRPISTSLFYAGTIQPLKAVVVTSPTEGVVEDMAFHYGDVVQAQQPLFVISSSKFQTDYKSALVQYIKNKADYNNNESQLKAKDFLHKNQLISDDDYKSAQNNYFNSQLSFIQAKDALAEMLKQLDIKDIKFEDLTIADIGKINSLLHQKDGSQRIHVFAPVAGVILLATKDESDVTLKINKGSPVKQGDVLGMVGDISGLSIHINVNEFNVNQLKVGQKVRVTGTAFSQFTLEGQISGIDRQGQSSSGGVPIFPVEIIVPHLTPEQQTVIHIGMSAKVEINIEGPPVVTVPIAAVYTKNNVAYVKMRDSNSHKIVEVPVKTGQTTEDSVVIESPLKAGDKVVLSH